jgi:hypothetical protein
LPLAIAGAAALALPAAADAQIYRCLDASGKLIFSGDPASCASAVPHEIEGELQTVPIERPATRRLPARPAPAAATAPADDARGELFWRQKKQMAEHRLSRLEAQAERLSHVVDACASGKRVYWRRENGRQKVDCHGAGDDYDALRGEIALAHECRRAGCLPGWVR